MQNIKPNLIKGSFYVLLAFFCMAVFGIFTKMASQGNSKLWISFITYATATVALLFFVLPQGMNFLKTKHILYHLGRSIFGLTASFLYMISMQNISMVDATLLFNTTPLFIPLLATLWLKTPISKNTWIAIAVGFLGIILIIKPNAAIISQPGDVIGLASGIFLAIAYILVKKLSESDPALRIIFYFFFISTLIQLPFLFYSNSSPNFYDCFLAATGGLIFLLAQLFLVWGYQCADVSKVGIYQYTSIIFVGIIEWLFWGITPPLSDLPGVILVILAGSIIIRSGQNSPKLNKD